MNNFRNKLNSWKDSFYTRKKYSTMDRGPFYEIARPYLPEDKTGIIVDIGAGKGGFATQLDLYDKYTHIFLLDANDQSVQDLKKNRANAVLYSVPEKLPLEDNTVSLIHCSHLVEHLHHKELHAFLAEINRVLKEDGILIISAPLLWDKFFCDLSHVKPYYPNVFINYLCSLPDQRTEAFISADFTVRELVYRYIITNAVEWGADNIVLDIFIQLFRKTLNRLGINQYQKNGFTLVLQKRCNEDRTT